MITELCLNSRLKIAYGAFKEIFFYNICSEGGKIIQKYIRQQKHQRL